MDNMFLVYGDGIMHVKRPGKFNHVSRFGSWLCLNLQDQKKVGKWSCPTWYLSGVSVMGRYVEMQGMETGTAFLHGKVVTKALSKGFPGPVPGF